MNVRSFSVDHWVSDNAVITKVVIWKLLSCPLKFSSRSKNRKAWTEWICVSKSYVMNSKPSSNGCDSQIRIIRNRNFWLSAFFSLIELYRKHWPAKYYKFHLLLIIFNLHKLRSSAKCKTRLCKVNYFATQWLKSTQSAALIMYRFQISSNFVSSRVWNDYTWILAIICCRNNWTSSLRCTTSSVQTTLRSTSLIRTPWSVTLHCFKQNFKILCNVQWIKPQNLHCVKPRKFWRTKVFVQSKTERINW